MAFSLKKALRGLRTALPIVGAVVPGGGVIGGALKIGAKLAAGRRSAGSAISATGIAAPMGFRATTVAYDGVVSPDTGGGYPQRTAGPMAPAIAAGARGIIGAILTKIRNYIGQRISRSQAVAVMKRLGFEIGATALGITAFEAVTLLLAEDRGRRRRRGITGRDITRTRRTLRKLEGLACAFTSAQGALRPYAARRRAKACR